MPLAMEPAPEIGSYDDVSWYRKTWFVVLMIFVLWPVAIVIALTGPTYQKANAKMSRQSPAEVWQSTVGGRAIMAVCGLVLGALAVPQWLALADGLTSGSERVAAVPEVASSDGAERERAPLAAPTESEDDTDEAAPASTATEAPESTAPASGSPSTPHDVHLEKQQQATVTAASDFLGGPDIGSLLIRTIGDDRYGELPQLDDARLESATVRQEVDHDDGEILHVVSYYYLTDAEPSAALDTLRQAHLALGYVEDEVTVEEDDEGVITTTVDYEPFDAADLSYEGLSLGVIQDGPETTVRMFRYLAGARPVTATSLVGGVANSFPALPGAEIDSSEVNMYDYGSGARTDLRHVVRVDGPAAEALDATVALADPAWERDPSSSGVYLRSDDYDIYLSSSRIGEITRVRYSVS